MTAHPYPRKLVTAVANVLWPEMYVSDRAYELADKALSALWEASRIDLGDLAGLSDDAVVHTSIGRTEFVRTFHHTQTIHDYPAAVIYWGDAV